MNIFGWFWLIKVGHQAQIFLPENCKRIFEAPNGIHRHFSWKLESQIWFISQQPQVSNFNQVIKLIKIRLLRWHLEKNILMSQDSSFI